MSEAARMEQVEQARIAARLRYAGEVMAHRSCGVALAETFGCGIRPYTALRRGGLTGEHDCGAMRAGEMVLAELLGSDDPGAAIPPGLQAAITEFRRRCREQYGQAGSCRMTCNDLTEPFVEFHDSPRKRFCTELVETVAAHVAELVLEHGAEVRVIPAEGSSPAT